MKHAVPHASYEIVTWGIAKKWRLGDVRRNQAQKVEARFWIVGGPQKQKFLSCSVKIERIGRLERTPSNFNLALDSLSKHVVTAVGNSKVIVLRLLLRPVASRDVIDSGSTKLIKEGC